MASTGKNLAPRRRPQQDQPRHRRHHRARQKGWEYLWVRYKDAEDAAAKAIAKRPVQADVNMVYEAGDFSQLGIGT